MARARNIKLKSVMIKPEIFKCEKLNSAGAEATLLFIGLSMLSDKHNYCDLDISFIKNQLFKNEKETDVSTWIAKLADNNLIEIGFTSPEIKILDFKKYFSRKSDPFKSSHYSGIRRAKKLKATPEWADLKKIKDIYKSAITKSNINATYHVDHIVPLQGKNVCGLHVEFNLQIITSTENIKKSNKFEI